jgi:hypothetical protein
MYHKEDTQGHLFPCCEDGFIEVDENLIKNKEMQRDDEIYGRIYRNIRAYHSFTNDYLDTCSDEKLISLSHPLQRDEFSKLLLGTRWGVVEEYLPNLDDNDQKENNELDDLG